MRAFTCVATRRRLDSFQDGELSVSEQIAIASHLEGCDACAATARETQLVGAALRAATPGRELLSNEEAATFAASIVSRSNAERDVSLLASIPLMFADLRLVYSGLGAAAAMLACAIGMLAMLRVAAHERPDSLIMATFLATPGIVADDDEVRSRWTARVREANRWAEQEAVFALSAMLTSDGRVPALQGLRRGLRASAERAKLIEGLLDSLSRARFEPLDEGQPTSHLVWLIESTTVRASKAQALDLPLPARKRHADSTPPPGSVRA